MKYLETMLLCHYVQGVVAGGETKCPGGAMSGLYGGCNITSQPSLNQFWRVGKDVCGVALPWLKIKPLRLADSGRCPSIEVFNLFS